MSKGNISSISVLNRTVTFSTDEGERTYKYSKDAIRKVIQDGRDPADFQATPVKDKKS